MGLRAQYRRSAKEGATAGCRNATLAVAPGLQSCNPPASRTGNLDTNRSLMLLGKVLSVLFGPFVFSDAARHTRTQAKNGDGSGCSRQPAITPTESQEKGAGTTSINQSSIYTHVLNRGGRGVRSPVDGLALSLPAGRPYR